MKIKREFDGVAMEVGAVKPCPFCGSHKYLTLTSKKSYNDLCAENGKSLIYIECTQCDLRLSEYNIPENNYDFGMGMLIARWNGRWIANDAAEQD